MHSKLKVNLSYIVRPEVELGGWDRKKGKEKERKEGMGNLAQLRCLLCETLSTHPPALPCSFLPLYCVVTTKFGGYWFLYLLKTLKSMNIEAGLGGARL